ncbi:MAG TPA: TolC family protein [Rhodothermia bacterium]|nr:TolC family protein [Rhodothermia bacterium]
MKGNLPGLALALIALLSARPTVAQVEHIAAGDTVELSLQEVVRLAVARSPEVAEMEAGLTFAQARGSQARASRFLPEFNATTAHAPAPGLSSSEFPNNELYLDPDVRNDWDKVRFFNQVEITLAQPLLTWGELSGSIDAAESGAEVADARVREKALAVASRAAELYFNVQLTEELVRLVGETEDILRRAKSEIRRLQDEGAADVDDADLYEVLITEQEFLRSKVEAEQKHMLAASALSRQLFLPEGATAIPDRRQLIPVTYSAGDLSVYMSRSLDLRPELQQASAGLEARDALVRVARSDYKPKLFLGATAGVRDTPGRHSQPNPYISDPLIGRSIRAGIGIRQNLNFSITRAKVRQAEAQRDEIFHKLRAADQLIRFDVEQAYRNLLIARAALDAQNEALRLSNEWLRTEEINFDLELGDTENLVRAVRSNLQLQARYFEAVRDYNVSVVRMLDAVGLLSDPDAIGTLFE